MTLEEKIRQFTQLQLQRGASPERIQRYLATKTGGGKGLSSAFTREWAIREIQRNPKQQAAITAMWKMANPEEEEDTAQQRKRIAALQQVVPILNSLRETVEGSAGGWKGWFRATAGKAIPGYEGGADEALKRLSEGYARAIANALATEVGVATDKDIRRWMGLMPRAKDSKDEQVEYLNRLMKHVETESQALGIDIQAILPEEERGGVAAPGVAGGRPPTAPPGVSPTIAMLGGVQEKLGRSQALPAGLGILGGLAAGPWGVAGGTYTGERLRQALQRGGPGAFIPTTEEQRGAGLKAASAGLVSAALPHALRPLQTIKRGLAGATTKLAGDVTVPRSAIEETLRQAVSRAPLGGQQQVAGQAQQLLGEIPGKEVGALATRRGMTGAFEQLNPAQEAVRKLMSQQIGQQAPLAKIPDWLYGLLSGGERAVKRFLPWQVMRRFGR